jgi:hypothetical protein
MMKNGTMRPIVSPSTRFLCCSSLSTFPLLSTTVVDEGVLMFCVAEVVSRMVSVVCMVVVYAAQI